MVSLSEINQGKFWSQNLISTWSSTFSLSGIEKEAVEIIEEIMKQFSEIESKSFSKWKLLQINWMEEDRFWWNSGFRNSCERFSTKYESIQALISDRSRIEQIWAWRKKSKFTNQELAALNNQELRSGFPGMLKQNSVEWKKDVRIQFKVKGRILRKIIPYNLANYSK